MTSTIAATVATCAVTCCGCTSQCGVLVEADGKRIRAVRGDPMHPVSAGYICPKGTDAPDLVYHPDRVLTPRKRVGPRGSGRWIEVDWDSTLDDIAARIADTTKVHGRRALAYSYGTFRGGDWGIGERFMNRYGSPNACGQDKICYGPLALAETLTYGMGPTVFSAPVAGVTRCVVVWGMRPSASAPLLWRAIRAAHAAGAALVVIDPKRTREAARADRWLAPRPGRDAELALALLKVVVEEGLIETDFVRDHCSGYAALARHLVSFELDALAEACGVPRTDIVALARLVASSGPLILNAGNGLCQSGTPGMHTARAIAILIAVTGNLGRTGGHALGGPPRDLRANGSLFDAELLLEPVRRMRLGAEHYPFLGAGELEVGRAQAVAWYGQHHSASWFATAHEPSLWRAIADAEPYPVTALVVQHHNPLGANGNLRAVERALASPRLALLVVHDLFMTPTAAYADYVLPAAHWLEKPYLSFGIGFVGAFGDYVAASQAAVAAPPGVRSDYELWRDLGQRLDSAAAWPDKVEDFYSTCVAGAGLDFATVAARGPLVGADARHPQGADAAVAAPSRYGTPSGRIELESSLLAGWGLPPLPTPARPALERAGGAYPLVLTTGGRRIEAFHENAQHMPRFRAHYPHPRALIHPATAAHAGIAAGDWMCIETPLGSVRQQAEYSETVQADVIEADRWWYPEGTGDAGDAYGVWSTNINVATSDAQADSDATMGAWLLRGLPCRVRRA